MDITINRQNIRYAAVFMTLLYAFITRSIFAKFIFQNWIGLISFYAVTYACLAISFVNAFGYDGVFIYMPKKLFGILAVFFVITVGLCIKGDMYDLIYYGLALLLPFAVGQDIRKSSFFAKFFVVMGLFFAFGCILNVLFPAEFKAVFVPMFSQSGQASLASVEEISGTSTYFAGFTSQVGYTSFYLALGIGAVFCFREVFFKQVWIFMIGGMLAGVLLTGKRGPLVFLMAALSAVYFIDGYGVERVIRVLQIVGALVVGFVMLTIIANATQLDGIMRIYEAVLDLITSGSVEDAGREQLKRQAMYYFELRPIFGIGWNNFKDVYYTRGTYVHCIYIQLLCETGLVGFCVFMAFFGSRLFHTIALVMRSRKNGVTLESQFISFSLFVQLYFLLYGITGNPLYDIEETILYFFAVGISYIPLKSEEPAPDDKSPNRRRSIYERSHTNLSIRS